ncbi:MAG: transglutaminase family protein [Marinagarivorans sp.]
MQAYLQSSDIIDWQHPQVFALAQALGKHQTSAQGIARACFNYVRDEISHSWDAQQNPVTLRASEVLREKTGFCYAKSHLLAALLRANGLPAALCYQRLTITCAPPFCLHGLNAVYLPHVGWYRLDARGNKPGVNAQFNPPQEQLAFSLVHPGEQDWPGRYAEPLPAITQLLSTCRHISEVFERLAQTDHQQPL